MTKQRHKTRSKSAAKNAAHAQEMQRLLQTAIAAHQKGDLPTAENCYRALLSVDPEHVDALNMLGALANQVGQSAAACELIAKAIALRPDLTQFQYNYGVVLQAEGRIDEAIDAYRHSLRVEPERVALHENLGTALHDSGRVEEAVQHWREALRLDPHSLIAHKNLGTCAFNVGDGQAALKYFHALVALDPASAEAHEKLATALLRAGEFERGFDEYEWRFCSPSFAVRNPPAYAPYPKWRGGSLHGRTLLINAEQGVGDEVMFSRLFPTIIEQAAHCVIECDARLRPMFARSFPRADIVSRGEIPDDLAIDWRISAGSLPRLLAWQPTQQPKPWLQNDAAAVTRWHKQLDDGRQRLNVGISWRGGGDDRARQARSIALENWRTLIDDPNVRAINLQYGDHADEIAAFNAGGPGQLECLPDIDPTTDLDDLGALIGALDLVITIDNSTAHLAGAVGTSTWLLLTKGPDWRWQDGHDVTAWYPLVTLWRQYSDRPADWSPVLERVAARLAGTAAAPRQLPRAVPPAEHTARVPTRATTGPNWVLLNDTTHWYHWGCTATSLAIHDQLRRSGRVVAALPIHAASALPGVPTDVAGFASKDVFQRFRQQLPQLVEQLEHADAICINGEGTLHRLTPAVLNLLYLAQVCAVHLGKPVHIINHSCYPPADQPTAQALYREAYRHVERIGIREGHSAQVMRDLGLPVVDTFDCLPLYVDQLWQRDVPVGADYVLLAGCVHWPGDTQAAIPMLATELIKQGLQVRLLLGANAYAAADDIHFARTLMNACPGQVTVQWTHSESDWLNAIAGARLLVSGRFHHSIAAAFVDTPFIVASSNTPKIEGLLERLQLENALPTTNGTAGIAAALLGAAQARLNTPQAYRMATATRANLLNLARRNFVVPGRAATHDSGRVNERVLESES